MRNIFKIGWERFKGCCSFSKSSSDSGKSCLTTCMEKISSCDSDIKVADIVFVHGLSGNAIDTWTNSNGFCWPREIGKELSNVDIWTLGYNASPTGQTLALPNLAANIVARLKNAKVGSYPIMFVCHSLGGLVVKQILRNCSDRKDKARSIFDETKGVIFLATPHAGSLWTAALKKIPLINGSLLFQALEWNDPHLYDLNLWFRDNFKGEVSVYFETLPTAGIMVVDTNSSDPGMPCVRPVPVEADHIEICKPATADELVYVDSKSLIEQVFFCKTIEAKVLSEKLLHTICISSLVAYQKELFFLDLTKCISRSISKQIRSSICNERKSIQFLVGESGFGKSTLAFQSLKEYIDAGGFGLWLPTSIVHESHSIQSAITKVIASHYPAVTTDFVNSLFEHFSSINKLLIIVDDINQEKDSMKIANKLISWAALVKGEKEEKNSASSIICCPIWPQLWHGIDIVAKQQVWFDVIFIETFDNVEGTEALLLSNDTLTSRIEAETLASKLGHDPILITLFSLIHKKMLNNSLDVLAEDVIDQYISQCISKIATSEQSFLKNEYQQALLDLSMCMIKNKNMHPTWTDVSEWSAQNEKSLELIRGFIRTDFICRLNDQDKLLFRHDRIQSTLLVKAMIRLFEMKKDIDGILVEPYYSELIAKALLRNNDIEMIKRLKKENILALVEALRIFGTAKTALECAILKEICDWIKEHKHIPNSLFHFMCLSLVETDSPSVLDITQEFVPTRIVLLARLRNGCAVSGVRYCISFVVTPSTGDKLRDRIIEHSKQRHHGELIRQLKLLLNNTEVSDDFREGVLTFVGFMSSEELSEYILHYWRSAKDKQRLLPKAIWAGMRCSGSNPNIILDELLAFWAALPEKGDNERSPQYVVAEYLRDSFNYKVEEKIIDYLCEQQKKNDNLKWSITYMLEKVDSPQTLGIVVKMAADIQREIEGTDRFSPWVEMLTDTWSERRSESRRLSDRSFTSLYKIWTTTTDKYIQEISFRLWLTRVGKENIELLQNIPSDFGIYESSLWKRAQLGDVTVVSDFAIMLKEKCRWCNVAHYIWSLEIMDVVKQHILSFEVDIPKDFSGGMLDQHFAVSELIARVPAQDAETLLVDYWYILGYSPLFIQAALYLSTQKSLDLAARSINNCPVEVNLFKYISNMFGFFNERRNLLTEMKLNSLIPYLDRLSESELWEIVEACERLGIPEWGKKYVVLNEDYRRRYNPSDNDLMIELNDMARNQHRLFSIDFWLRYFNSRNDGYERALRITDKWLETSKRDCVSYEIAASVIKSVGDRKDINILYKYQTDNISETMLCEIIEDTKFAVWKRTLE